VIRLCGDDFKPANVLGSHKTPYKIGCIYHQFENMLAFQQSKVDIIFLALCYNLEDVKNFVFAAVLATFHCKRTLTMPGRLKS
jgi:hypothetical protein